MNLEASMQGVRSSQSSGMIAGQRGLPRSRSGLIALSAGAVAMLFAAPPLLANGFTTAHQFAVSESGAATITIPIQVPRGIAGLEPQLSLNYSSSGGNGLLGIGWILSGPSAITRCPKSAHLDGSRGSVNFDAGDRFCLDGQRLVTLTPGENTDALYGANGREYRTERDSFSRIKAVGNYGGQTSVPERFTVETKAGLILDFGLSANSRVLTNFSAGLGRTATINRWLLQRISDRNGNFVEYVYCAGEVSADGLGCSTTSWSGSTVLQYIRYTNRNSTVDGAYAVVFKYEARPDKVQGFHAGSATRQTQRMTRIETQRGVSGTAPSLQAGTLVRAYTITYESGLNGTTSTRATNSSRIVQIQESDQTGATLPPLTFTLAPDSVFGMAVAQKSTATPGTPPPPLGCGGVTGSRYTLQCP